MKILDQDELRTAEQVLRCYLPKSSKVYGFLFGMNRNKPCTLEVAVDSWPDFKSIIFRPDQKNEHVSDYMKKVTLFCTDVQVLKRMILEENAIDWTTYFLIGGFNISLAPMLKEVAASRGVNVRGFTLVHLMSLSDPCDLPELPDNSIVTRICSLNESHIDIVNKTWKFGGNEKGYNNIKNLISHFPSCCIADETGQPVSWVLVYDYCALGLLYTLPEHRGKGYAKTLITVMSKKLHAQGYPVYCFIEEENDISFRLFKSLGFTEDPSYRAAWFEFNY
ncbi:glycine N-acyltransferase-like protein 3 isoform X2 [Clupea harengus]|uniref:Glycine N-acyltransferase-like protein n=1 Tax=Clupea harengus TaxID=7950 RepID=A0A8M1KLA2_CLUHA|nr:glycine N-acyltransferase-like protein 3 isoform X2 [Clupea harengus]